MRTSEYPWLPSSSIRNAGLLLALLFVIETLLNRASSRATPPGRSKVSRPA
jgi:hypothetical protein